MPELPKLPKSSTLGVYTNSSEERREFLKRKGIVDEPDSVIEQQITPESRKKRIFEIGSKLKFLERKWEDSRRERGVVIKDQKAVAEIIEQMKKIEIEQKELEAELAELEKTPEK